MRLASLPSSSISETLRYQQYPSHFLTFQSDQGSALTTSPRHRLLLLIISTDAEAFARLALKGFTMSLQSDTINFHKTLT
jgi:hypothetical protein